jgi:fido (protein-threonine AMPylation protein)
MIALLPSPEGNGRRIREWLLLLLRFAITRESADRLTALAAADELDASGGSWRPAAPRFFARTSNEVCDATAAADEAAGRAVLKKHLARIDDARLRRAFRAAIETGQGSDAHGERESAMRRRRVDRDLWKGLTRANETPWSRFRARS